MTADERERFVDWVENSDLVQLDDFTRDVYRTVYLDPTDDPDHQTVRTVAEKAQRAGYEFVHRDESERLVFSVDGTDPRLTITEQRA